MPLFRNASSRSRAARMSQENSIVLKIWSSGYHVTFVPRSAHEPMTSSGDFVTPRSKRMR